MCVCSAASVVFNSLWSHGPHNSLPGSSVHELLQASILEWVAMLSSGGSSWPRDRIWVSSISCTGRWVLYHWRYLGSPSNTLGVIIYQGFGKKKSYWTWFLHSQSPEPSTGPRKATPCEIRLLGPGNKNKTELWNHCSPPCKILLLHKYLLCIWYM